MNGSDAANCRHDWRVQDCYLWTLYCALCGKVVRRQRLSKSDVGLKEDAVPLSEPSAAESIDAEDLRVRAREDERIALERRERAAARSRVVMDYPTAWEFVRTTDPADHHEKCSWRQTNGALLCDCDVLWDEYERRGGIGDAGYERAVKP